MKKLILSLFFLNCLSHAGAQKYFTRTGKVSFYASTPLEKIEAVNKGTSAIMNTNTGELAFQVAIKGFLFEKTLMQEHFNENYLESNLYPTATFKGKINEPATIDLKENKTIPVNAEGDLSIHGVTKKVKVTGNINITNGAINLSSRFTVKPADYKIIIPTLVKDKIAKEIQITVDCKLQPMK